MPSTDDEVRALKRELAGTRAKLSQQVRNEIMAQLAARGAAPSAPAVERRTSARSKKAAE
jgi:hypothetical protein